MERVIENTAKWRKTKRGLITNLYGKLKERNEVTFTLNYLHDFSNCKKFDRLFLEWEKSGYEKLKKPTIDRINNKYGYSERNIQWLSWGDNRYKQTMERRSRKGVVIQLLNGIEVARFKSQKECVLKTGLTQSNISMVLSGKRNHVSVYTFIYENPELLSTDKTKTV